MRNFNEVLDVPGPTIQHTITTGELSAIGVAFLRPSVRFAGEVVALPACVMATVRANTLIATLPTDRMPAILDDADWDLRLRGRRMKRMLASRR
jgi:hypothetical protein